jgi:hypothetical protein
VPVIELRKEIADHRRRDDRWADGKGCVIAAIALQA